MSTIDFDISGNVNIDYNTISSYINFPYNPRLETTSGFIYIPPPKITISGIIKISSNVIYIKYTDKNPYKINLLTNNWITDVISSRHRSAFFRGFLTISGGAFTSYDDSYFYKKIIFKNSDNNINIGNDTNNNGSSNLILGNNMATHIKNTAER